VVADVDGYQQSLAERQSSRVGQEYHLVPVALAKGVFHPKCSYLSGPDGDFLMANSGNLTFGGLPAWPCVAVKPVIFRLTSTGD